MRPPLFVAAGLVAGLLTVSTACAKQSAPSAPRSAPPGTIVGVYVERSRDASKGKPVAGVTIGAFTRAFLPGPVWYGTPGPVAQTVTDHDGGFRIQGLSPGRYFVVPTNSAAVAVGRWVVVTSDHGATVSLTGCTDCPPPA